MGGHENGKTFVSFALEALSCNGNIQEAESGPDVGQITKQLKAVNDYFQRWEFPERGARVVEPA